MISQQEEPSKLVGFFREYQPEIKFIVIFCFGLLLAFFTLSNKFIGENAVKPLTAGQAYVASNILNLVGFPNRQNGILVSSAPEAKYKFGMEVKNNCNGVFESIVFLMAFVAIQIPWRRKFGWMMVGFTIFHVINMMRLVSLFVIGSMYDKPTFDFFHETFWNYTLVLLTLGIFIFCAHQAIKAPATPSAADAVT